MKVLFIGGVFAEANEEEIIEAARRPVEFSANTFQKKIIEGLKQADVEEEVISAPFIGSFPFAGKKMFFSGFQQTQEEYKYVHFNNIWGLRNFSRARALKKGLKGFIKEKKEKKLIVVYSPHTPFLEAASYAKKKDPSIKVCIVIPDLPQFMNLDTNVSPIYNFAKQFDIKKFNKLNDCIDSYILLTEQMKEKLPIGNKPYAVVEGIVSSCAIHSATRNSENTKKEKLIVYTGKLYEKFGAKELVDAFATLDNPMYRLVICGKGDSEDYIKEKAKLDRRIQYLGQVTPKQAQEWVSAADVLVNPRPDNEEYTKYSFPSKNIEYLVSGKPVVAYLLSGMPDCYKDFIYPVGESLAQAIEQAITDSEENKKRKYQAACEHLKTLSEQAVAERIIETTFCSEK